MTTEKIGISYIVPAYNEENGIESTIERLRETLGKLDRPWEIIVVNDGSRDRTLEVLKSFEGIRVLSHPINTGYGSAIKTGIANARHEWIGIVDADGTYEIERLPDLVEKMEEGFDMVVAARENVLELDKPMKRFFRRVLRFAVKLVVAARIVDPNSGFRLFTKTLATTFFPFLCNTFSFTTSITIFAMGEGFFVSYVPMPYSHREGKSKVRHFRDSLRLAQLILQGITFFNPIKFYILMAIGFILFVALPALGMIGLGWTNVAWVYFLSGLISVLLLGQGILGDLVRIANNMGQSVKGRWMPNHVTHNLAAFGSDGGEEKP